MKQILRTLILIGVLHICSLFLAISPARAGESKPIFLPVITQNFDSSWVWGIDEMVDLPSAFGGSDPFIVIDHNGYAHIFWDVGLSKPAFIYHTYQTPSGWTQPEAIAQTRGTSKLYSMPVIGADGVIHVVWYNSLNFGGPYRIMTASWANGQWNSEHEVYRSQNVYVAAQISVHTVNEPHIIIYDNNIMHGFIYYATRQNGQWTTVKVYPGYDVDTAWVDQAGGIRLVGDDLGSNFIIEAFYSYWRNGVFETQRQPLSGRINNRSQIVDRNDNVHFFNVSSVAVPGGNVNGVYHQCLTADLAWLDEEVISGYENIGAVQAASDKQGRLAWAWKNITDHAYDISIMDGCNSQMRQTSLTVPVGSSSFGDVASLAISEQPGKICLGRWMGFSEYHLICADLR